MNTYQIFWAPEGRCIATVQAADPKQAKKQTPKPYRKFMGEVYVEEIRCACDNELCTIHDGQCENDPTEQVLTDGGRVPMCKECADFDIDGGRKDGAQ